MKYQFDAMAPGDAFDVPYGNSVAETVRIGQRLRNAASTYGRVNGKKLRVRAIDSDLVYEVSRIDGTPLENKTRLKYPFESLTEPGQSFTLDASRCDPWALRGSVAASASHYGKTRGPLLRVQLLLVGGAHEVKVTRIEGVHRGYGPSTPQLP